ncbi:MAG: TolC family protein [Deltaproteobacteria bacterium]|nr:TolC family protein [Deltaproteobacteria bacterium]
MFSAFSGAGRQTSSTPARAMAALVLSLLLYHPASAQQLVLGEDVDPSMPDASLEVQEQAIQLSLERAVEIALQRNLDLLAQRYDRARAFHLENSEFGIYDLTLNGTAEVRDSSTPSATSLEGAAVRNDTTGDLNFSLSQLTPYGGVASFDWTNQRFETNNTFANLNPQFRSAFNLGFSQPLLRNFGREVTERRLKLARRDSSISQETFIQQVITTIQQVENAYWNLVRSRKQLEVAEESLTLARELHERNRIRVEVGTLAPFELVQSEAGIAQREGDIIRNQAEAGDAEDTLRALLHLQDGNLWDMEIFPVTEAMVEPFEVELGEEIQYALDHRSEMINQKLQLERLMIDSGYFRNQLKPQLDLVVGWGARTLDGDLFEDDPDTGERVLVSSGDIIDAVGDLPKADFDGFSIRLNFSVPLQNRAAKAQNAIAGLALDQGKIQTQSLAQSISTEVRSAVRQMDAAARGVEAARASRRAQEKNLDAERKRFDNGMSTSFQVLQIQEDLTQAQSSEVQAVTNYRTSLVEFYRTTGRVLEQHQIEVTADGE